MATASTSTSLSDHSVSKSLSKLRPLELSNDETCFLDGDLVVEFYIAIFTHLQTLSPYDKNIREFLIVEAQNRMTRRNEAGKEEDDGDDDSGESDSSEEQQILVVYGPFMTSRKISGRNLNSVCSFLISGYEESNSYDRRIQRSITAFQILKMPYIKPNKQPKITESLFTSNSTT